MSSRTSYKIADIPGQNPLYNKVKTPVIRLKPD